MYKHFDECLINYFTYLYFQIKFFYNNIFKEIILNVSKL